MHLITADAAPPAGGHYSHAVRANGFLFLAGQLPVRPDGGPMAQTVEGQTRQVLANISAVLESCGATLADVVSATVYVSDIGHWPEVNRAYAEAFGAHKPARTVAVSPALHYGCHVEIQVIAQARG